MDSKCENAKTCLLIQLDAISSESIQHSSLVYNSLISIVVDIVYLYA